MLRNWKLKAIVQKIISYLPWSEKINFFFQKHVTKAVNLSDEYFKDKILHAKNHIEYFREYTNKSNNQNIILEFGTGWYPIVPICMFLEDIGKVSSIDVKQWLNKKTQMTTIDKFIEWNDKALLTKYLTQINKHKWEKLLEIKKKYLSHSKESINNEIGLKLFVQDIRKIKIEANSIDLICSNNTLEHINQTVLVEIINKFKKISAKDGLMSHFIDMTDHFAHFDNKITIYNFLKYSNKTWSLIDNKIQPQNRMRLKDYIDIFEKSGLNIVVNKKRNGNLNELKKIKINDLYKKYNNDELIISHAHIVSKM